MTKEQDDIRAKKEATRETEKMKIIKKRQEIMGYYA